MPSSTPLLDRLATKFTVGDGCWEWSASKDTRGYGRIFVNGKAAPAHRVLYELLVGPIPEGLELDHLCRNRGCVRPSHAEPVTHHANVLRGDAGKHVRDRTHCPQGHPYSGENLLIDYRGARVCRACSRAATRRYRERRAA